MQLKKNSLQTSLHRYHTKKSRIPQKFYCKSYSGYCVPADQNQQEQYQFGTETIISNIGRLLFDVLICLHSMEPFRSNRFVKINSLPSDIFVDSRFHQTIPMIHKPILHHIRQDHEKLRGNTCRIFVCC